jgi:aquaporin Z
LLLIAKGAPTGYDPSDSGFAANGYAENSPGGFNLLSCFLTEVVLTSFLVFTVLGTTDIKAPLGFAGIAIGLVLVLIHLVGIPVTNTSVNPARSIGPAIFVKGWALEQLWLFIVAPIIGSAIAAGMYILVHRPEVVLTVQEGERALESEQAEKRS